MNVPRALWTVKAVSQTYRQPSARLRIARAPISIHILDPWSPDAPNDKFWYHFRQSQAQGRPDAQNGKFRYHFGSFRALGSCQGPQQGFTRTEQFRAVLAEARSLQPPDEHLLLISWGRKSYFKRSGPTEFLFFLHGVASSHMLQNALYAVGITLPGVQRALRLVGVLIYIQILDSWPSSRPFWLLGQLDTELVQIVDQNTSGRAS